MSKVFAPVSTLTAALLSLSFVAFSMTNNSKVHFALGRWFGQTGWWGGGCSGQERAPRTHLFISSTSPENASSFLIPTSDRGRAPWLAAARALWAVPPPLAHSLPGLGLQSSSRCCTRAHTLSSGRSGGELSSLSFFNFKKAVLLREERKHGRGVENVTELSER